MLFVSNSYLIHTVRLYDGLLVCCNFRPCLTDLHYENGSLPMSIKHDYNIPALG